MTVLISAFSDGYMAGSLGQAGKLTQILFVSSGVIPLVAAILVIHLLSRKSGESRSVELLLAVMSGGMIFLAVAVGMDWGMALLFIAVLVALIVEGNFSHGRGGWLVVLAPVAVLLWLMLDNPYIVDRITSFYAPMLAGEFLKRRGISML